MRTPVRLAAAVAVAMLALPAPALAGPDGISLHPVAGRFDPDTFQRLGNSTDAQAQWTNKEALAGRFSVLLEKSVDTAEPAFAGAAVEGVEGMTVADLGTIGFAVRGTCGAGAPRFNLSYDADGDGRSDGVAFYGCAANQAGSPAPGWTAMRADALAPANPTPANFATATVVSLAVLVDERGTYHVDQVTAAGHTTGEPDGG